MVSPLELAHKTYDKLVLHGKSTTIITYVDSYDPTTGVNNRTPTSHTVQTSPYLEYDIKYVDGDLIIRGDMYILFANYGLDFVPVNGMKADTIWFVVGVKEYFYQNSTIVYELQLRYA